jgi:hypothetical protein
MGRSNLWKMEGMSVFGMCGFFRVHICTIPDFSVVVFQYLLPSGHWNCAVRDAGTVPRYCSGQVVCPLVSFQPCVSFYLVAGNRGDHPYYFHCFSPDIHCYGLGKGEGVRNMYKGGRK